jgi:ataxia telangiectasia mutated family protein
LQSAWEKVAKLSLKFVSSLSCCRAACHLCDAIFQLKLVPGAVLKDAADNIISSVDLIGPAVVSDASMALWSTLLELKESENPSMAPFVSERALHWLFAKFTPSKYLSEGKKLIRLQVIR